MKRVPLYSIAHARSGDKGDGSNVGIMAYDERGYEVLVEWLTADRVKAHFGGIVRGDVKRYELPNLLALNFILHDSLGGSGSASLKTDAQVKTHAMALLRIEIELPDDYEPPHVGSRGARAPGGGCVPRPPGAAAPRGHGRGRHAAQPQGPWAPASSGAGGAGPRRPTCSATRASTW